MQEIFFYYSALCSVVSAGVYGSSIAGFGYDIKYFIIFYKMVIAIKYDCGVGAVRYFITLYDISYTTHSDGWAIGFCNSAKF